MVFLNIFGIARAELPVLQNVAKNPNEVGTPVGGRTAPTTIVVDLAAVEVVANITKDKVYKFWTFARADSSGRPIGKAAVPGPMIRCMEGDTIILNLTSNIPNLEPHNIDLHAVMGPGGGAAVTNVMPDGMTKTLQFKALREGAYIYHCAGEGMPWEHVAHGMFGMILVEPPGGLPMYIEGRPVKEFYLGQTEWYPTSTMVSDPGVSSYPFYDLDRYKAADEHPEIFSFNGHQNALSDRTIYGEAMLAHPGDIVRVFFVNGGPNMGSNFHIIGQIFDRVLKGSRLTPELNEETVYVAPGSAAIFEMVTPVPGMYLIVDHALFRVPKGAAGHLFVVPECGAIANPASWACAGWPDGIFSPATTSSGH
jgi:nitrite reductase (NO-forming)